MSFHTMGLSPWLCRVCDGLGMRQPTPVQTATIPLIMQNKQVCASACTGSGKTAAFVLPILHHLAKDPYGVFALIVTPSRELALQINQNVQTFGSPIGVRHVLLVGGMNIAEQVKAVRHRPHIVVGTPGRIFAVLEGPDAEVVFKKLRYFVLDEADVLLKDDFIEQIERLCLCIPTHRQTLFFSATIDGSIKKKLRQITDKPVEFISIAGKKKAPESLDERCLYIPHVLFYSYLAYILDPKVIPAKSVIIFTISRKKTELVKMTLSELGFPVTSISSSQPQKQRFRNLARFRAGKFRILVATDLASRGLDLPTVDLVINFDLPETPADYVHRVGRTARAGRAGVAVTFMLYSQKSIETLDKIGKYSKSNFQEYRLKEEEVSQNLSVVTQARLKAEKLYAKLFGQAEADAKRLEEIAEEQGVAVVKKRRRGLAQDAEEEPKPKKLLKKKKMKAIAEPEQKSEVKEEA